jgi:hypothetical protein
MDFRTVAAGAAVALCLGDAARADILVRNAPSVRTRAEACSQLKALADGFDPFADRKTADGDRAQAQAEAVAKRARAEICRRGRGGAQPPVAADGSQHFGPVVEGKPEGLGARFYGDGSRYIGEWKNGIRQGEGIGLQADGARYVGHFDNDRPHGKGVLQYHARIRMTVKEPAEGK